MAEREFSLGKIEQMKDPWIQEQETKSDAFISGDSELQARIQSLRNKMLTKEGFWQMIDGWNDDHKNENWGPTLNACLNGMNGEVLKIQMDMQGQVKLAGKYGTSR